MSLNPDVINHFKNFLSTEAMVDVTLECAGQSLKAHRIVLSAYSPFFRSLFLKNPCKHPIVILKDMQFTELKLVIDFMYCGEVNIAEDQLSSVIKTAQTLRVKGLGEVEFENSQSNGETENISGNVSRNQSRDKICFKWNNHMNVLNELKTYLSSETMVDVTLGCDGQNLKAHKIVLSAYSSFFRSLFLGNSCKHPIVVLKDVKYTELKSVIDFMYCGKVNLAKDQLSAIIKTAQSLKVKGLMEVGLRNSQSSDKSVNRTINGESKYQSGDELTHEPICMINVSNWTLTQKGSQSDQNVDGGFVTEIKQENVSDDMDVSILHTKISTVSLQHGNLFFKSEEDQRVEQNFDDQPVEQNFDDQLVVKNFDDQLVVQRFDESFSLEESFEDSTPNTILRGTLTKDNLPRQSFQSCVQSNMELHEACTGSTSNLVPVTSTVVDIQEPRTSSAPVRKSQRKKKKLKKIPEKPVKQMCDSQKLKVLNNLQTFPQNPSPLALENGPNNGTVYHLRDSIPRNNKNASDSGKVLQKNSGITNNSAPKTVKSKQKFKKSNKGQYEKLTDFSNTDEYIIDYRKKNTAELHITNAEDLNLKRPFISTQISNAKNEKGAKISKLTKVGKQCDNINILDDLLKVAKPDFADQQTSDLLLYNDPISADDTDSDSPFDPGHAIESDDSYTNPGIVNSKIRIQKKQQAMKAISQKDFESSSELERHQVQHIVKDSAPKKVQKKQKRKNNKKRAYETLTKFLDNRNKSIVDYKTESIAGGMRVLRCVKCSFKTRYTTTFKRHILCKHEKVKKFECERCTYRAALKHNLVRHISEVHENIIRFNCTLCPYTCAQHAQLRRHIASVHEHIKPFKCEKCDFRSSQKASVKNHIIAVHEQKRPHACPSCTYRCAQAQNLKRHIRLMHEKRRRNDV